MASHTKDKAVMQEEEWIRANAEQAEKALIRARGELYVLLGGQRDPKREREILAAEAGRLQLMMKRSRQASARRYDESGDHSVG